MTNYEGEIPYIPGTSLQEWVLDLARLKDDDCCLFIAEQMEKLVCELGSPQLDCQSGIESLEVTNGRVALEYPGRESSMVRSSSCEGSTARYTASTGIDVELEWVPSILMNYEDAIHDREETVKPG